MKDKDTLYARWLSGDLSPEELAELKSSGELQGLEAIVKMTDQASLPKYDVDQGLQRLQANLPAQKAQVRRLRPIYIMGIAASLLLVVALFFLIQPSNTKLEAARQNNLAHRFAEGSSVLINDGSQIKYREGKWEAERRLELQGEAFFEVEKGVPFIVETDKGQVEVLGTSFNVRAWGQRLNVSCFSGRVRVAGFGEELVLTQGQGVILSPGSSPLLTNPSGDRPGWTSGESSFEAEPLSEVFAELERQYDVSIQGNIPDRNLSGSFSNSNLESALRDICLPQSISYQISENGKVVTLD